ncbi:hypothetical protein TL16_g07223 [Triparma laevis f. inornata]|uniref:Structural maintenance of chromosomes protein n=1 Tax=Triparma laevis f. inornata TaxID=1714386 RepID=A0A9W7AR91_9STRA|nr:hypothetical protein TL16_g07223 [Triparma laevis f. inornata]
MSATTPTSAEAEGPKPRLMISKMVVHNFKSYAGTRTVGPFHKSFTAIVGPNGSGKSNNIDAMLFVFGKKAKKLRLNKISELIHSSEDYKLGGSKQLNSARVGVHFHEIIDTGKGDDDYTVIPNSECLVEREVIRGDPAAKIADKSNYYLNGKKSSFVDVAKYLNSKGIDLDNNRFLILQGEVEMISMMPPKGKNEDDDGLLEYLEDIIGSNKYVKDADEKFKDVEELTEERQGKLNRVKAVEKEKDSLSAAKGEAMMFVRVERKIRSKKNVLWQMNMAEVEDEKAITAAKKEKMAEKIEESENTLKEAEDRLTTIEKENESEVKLMNSLTQAKHNAKNTYDEFERRDIKLREDVKHGKVTIDKTTKKQAADNKKAKASAKKSTEATQNVPKFEAAVEKATSKKSTEDSKLEKIYEQMKGVTAQLRSTLEVKNAELGPVLEEKSEWEAKLDTAVTAKSLIEDSTARALTQLEKAQKELDDLDSFKSGKEEELEESEAKLEESKNRLPIAKKEEQEHEQQEEQLKNKYRSCMEKAEESKAALANAGGARSEAVSGILRASKKGGELAQAGIRGRLGDLAQIDSQYDVAVSTACGMLDHIVVNSTAGAQMALKFLRKHGLGRANFIPLDKMKRGAHDRQVETPEGVSRLFDLIQCPEEIKPAMFLGVGQTIVAENLNEATHLAYDFGKRWRVVTVDGQLIETSGTMAGGGGKVKKGGMKLANGKGGSSMDFVDADADMADEYEKKAQSAMAAYKECRERRKGLIEEIRSLEKIIKTLTVKVPKLRMEVEGVETTRDALTSSIPELKEASTMSKADEATLKDLKKEVAKIEKDMKSCTDLAAKLEAEVAEIQKNILDAGGEKLKKQQKACDAANAALKSANTELNAGKVDIESGKKAEAKALADAEEAGKLKEEEQAKLEKNMEELKALEEEAFEAMQKFEVARDEADAKAKEMEEKDKELDVLRGKVSECKLAAVELMGKLAVYDNQLKEHNGRTNFWLEEIKNLTKAEELDAEFDLSDDEESDDEEEEEEGGEEGEKMVDDEIPQEGEEGEEGEKKTEKKNKVKKNKVDPLPTLDEDDLADYNRKDLKVDIEVLEKERDALGKNANMSAIAEYRRKEADYLEKVKELDEITDRRNEARKAWDELRRMRLEKFMDGFGQITLKLKEMYQMITLGGDAELELVDSLDPFSEGIVFSVRPPKKSWKNIANLSGGEKTLSSLALVFALHHYKPTPLYVMDEIDAALDFKNVSIVANYIKERCQTAQFVVISLRNNMFELADRLVGIYKTSNSTKTVAINPRAFGKGKTVGLEEGEGEVGEQVVLGDRTNV